jgi:peptidylprolyl isomerase
MESSVRSAAVSSEEAFGQLLRVLRHLKFSECEGEKLMRRAQQGDHVQVHYVKRFQDGSTASSRGQSPLEVTIGTAHARLPGLGLALVGLAVGECRALKVPAEQAYGLRNPSRVRTVNRKFFPANKALLVGRWVRISGRRRPRLVRILEWNDEKVVIDTNHRRAGQALELEVELIAILDSSAGLNDSNPNQERPTKAPGVRQPPAETFSGDADDGTRSGHRL